MATETVLITGASSGIGLELARLFARDGSNVILVARSADKLQQLADELRAHYRVTAHVLPVDLSRREAPARIKAFTDEHGLAVDVLVNNAGFGARGAFADLELERQMEMVQVNVTALTELSRIYLPGMIARRRGGVLNVASTAAFQPGPHMAVYYATKAYVLSLSEGLAEEARPHGVTISCLAPGPTETHFGEVSGMHKSLLFRYAPRASARSVALTGYNGFRKGRVLVITGAFNRIGAFAVRFAPRVLARKATQLFNR